MKKNKIFHPLKLFEDEKRCRLSVVCVCFFFFRKFSDKCFYEAIIFGHWKSTLACCENDHYSQRKNDPYSKYCQQTVLGRRHVSASHMQNLWNFPKSVYCTARCMHLTRTHTHKRKHKHTHNAIGGRGFWASPHVLLRIRTVLVICLICFWSFTCA